MGKEQSTVKWKSGQSPDSREISGIMSLFKTVKPIRWLRPEPEHVRKLVPGLAHTFFGVVSNIFPTEIAPQLPTKLTTVA